MAVHQITPAARGNRASAGRCSPLVSSSLRDLQENTRAFSVACQKSAYCRPTVRRPVYSNCRVRHAELISRVQERPARPGRQQAADRKPPAHRNAIALILALDTAAITGSAESAAAAPAPTKLTKSLRFNVVLTPVILDEHHHHLNFCVLAQCLISFCPS